MRGIRFANLLAGPFILGAIVLLYFIFFLGRQDLVYYLTPFILILLSIYFKSNDINYWYHKKYPPKLDPAIINWLSNFFPFYKELSEEDMEKFEFRLALYLEGRAFKLVLMKEQKNIPEDFKAIIAAHAIHMTMDMKNYLLEPYERIFCYNHPFPSPEKQFLHTVEVQTEDKVILISLEQLMLGINHPDKFYNLAYHAYAEILLDLKSKKNFPEMTWENIETISDYSKENILNLTGYQDLDLSAVLLTLFFSKKEQFNNAFPEQYQLIQEWLKDG